MFTLNNPDDDQAPTLWGAQYITWQLEKGAEGTPHLQGYAEFEKAHRLSALKKKCAQAHWEPRKGSQAQAIAYCNKTDTREAGPWSHGATKSQGKRNDIHAMAEDIVNNNLQFNDLVQDYPAMIIKYSKGIDRLIAATQEMYEHDDVRGVWIYGEPGTGKSHYANNLHPDAYRKAQNKWFDGYAGHDTIILDDFDKGGTCLGHYLKIWTDKYKCTGEIKGGTVCLRHKKFIVTSNYRIEDLWAEDQQMMKAIKRRFQCICKDTIYKHKKKETLYLPQTHNP